MKDAEKAIDAAWGVREDALSALVQAYHAAEPRRDERYGNERVHEQQLKNLIDADAAWKHAIEENARHL